MSGARYLSLLMFLPKMKRLFRRPELTSSEFMIRNVNFETNKTESLKLLDKFFAQQQGIEPSLDRSEEIPEPQK